jgi:hypothetical protein
MEYRLFSLYVIGLLALLVLTRRKQPLEEIGYGDSECLHNDDDIFFIFSCTVWLRHHLKPSHLLEMRDQGRSIFFAQISHDVTEAGLGQVVH